MLRHRRATRIAFALTVSTACLGVAACGEGVDPAAAPRIGGERFEVIRFEDVWRPQGAVIIERTTVEGVQREELEVPGGEPGPLVDAYADQLEADGWVEIDEPQQRVDGSWIGSWQRAGRILIVEAEEATVGEDDVDPTADIVLSFSRTTPGM